MCVKEIKPLINFQIIFQHFDANFDALALQFEVTGAPCVRGTPFLAAILHLQTRRGTTPGERHREVHSRLRIRTSIQLYHVIYSLVLRKLSAIFIPQSAKNDKLI